MQQCSCTTAHAFSICATAVVFLLAIVVILSASLQFHTNHCFVEPVYLDIPLPENPPKPEEPKPKKPAKIREWDRGKGLIFRVTKFQLENFNVVWHFSCCTKAKIELFYKFQIPGHCTRSFI